MAEQMDTPGSNADVSVNGTKAPKDKACPFCHQSFTSSSLGRHLDLYIKEKNPKPADGIHDVEQIRKMRGGITRRQARNSSARREGSTPAGTPATQERRSPRSESEIRENQSPTLRKNMSVSSDLIRNNGEMAGIDGKSRFLMNNASWEATGVMNNIPTARMGSWVGEERDGPRGLEGRSRTVSKQLLAKSTFEQKQKIMEAMDTAKAAELALREVVGSFRAAKQRIEGPVIFDYDPLTLDFPALCLHCLPPPPTLYQSTPVATSESWSISPPEEKQYQALRNHFSSKFRHFRISCDIVTTAPQDDLSYPPPQLGRVDDPAEIAEQAKADASAMEAKINEHIDSMLMHWVSLSAARRTELWTLELARNVGKKAEEIQRLNKEKDMVQQELGHLRIQHDELSRLQQPREFRIMPPSTFPVDSKLINEVAELGMTKQQGVGWNLVDRSLQVDEVVERAINRWKGVVKQARGGGIAAQRSLSDETSTTALRKPSSAAQNINGMPGAGSDADADADADMEEDDSYVDSTMTDTNQAQPAGTNFRLANGNRNGNQQSENPRAVDGVENGTYVGGYVRIGA